MRRFLTTTLLGVVFAAAWPVAETLAKSQDRPRADAATAGSALTTALNRGITEAGKQSSAYVVDLNTGKVLFSARAQTPRLPASVEKLYTTSTALLRFGPSGTLNTSVYGSGGLRGTTWVGNLYLKGGGDPSFGASGYDAHAYGGGTTLQHLVANLLSSSGIRAIRGKLIGDESYFDSVRGTPATHNNLSSDVEGELSGLVFDRGFTDLAGTAFQTRPALFSTDAFAATLAANHIRVPAGAQITTGTTPSGAKLLATVRSPRISTLIRWTNTPSDNFFAEMLVKGIGARYGRAGTTAAGVAVVKAQIAQSFGIHPAFNDGSGLSYSDYTTPIEVVTLLRKMAGDADFTNSLAVAGDSGTLIDEMKHTGAQGRCRGKTGTLIAVSNLVGYCTARDGHTLAFALMMSAVNPDAAHPIQNRMVEALAAYDG